MCTKCREFDATFMMAHDEQRCPFAACLYCSVCAAYGHTIEDCVVRPAAQYTEPCFVEQLIPSTARPLSRTPLHTLTGDEVEETINKNVNAAIRNEELTNQGVLRIKKDDKVIRAHLMARSLLGTRIKTKNCRDMLDKHAKEEGKRISCYPEVWNSSV